MMLDPWRKMQPGEGGGAPRYLVLADRVALAMEHEQLRPGQVLPPERTLSELTGLSRSTVRKAIGSLTERGLVSSRHGSGTFVTMRIHQPLAQLSSFSEDMAGRGVRTSQIWLERLVRTPSAEEAVALALPAGAVVSSLRRIRCAGEERLALEHAVVPAAWLPDPVVVTGSLYAVLEGRGHILARALQRLRAGSATAGEARLLDIEAGSPVMHTVRHGYRQDGMMVEFTRSVYRGDRYDFVAEMRRLKR